MTEGRGPARPGHQRGFLELVVDRQHRDRPVAQAVGKEARNVREQEDPQRAVDRQRQHQVEPKNRDAEHQTGHGNGAEGQKVERAFAVPLGAHDHPGDDGGEQHGDRRARDSQHETVPQGAMDQGQVPEIFVIFQGQAVQRGFRRRHIKRQKRRPDDDQHRQEKHHRADQKIQHRDRPSPAAQIINRRPKAFAGDGGELIRQRGPFEIEQHSHSGDGQINHCEGAGQTEVGRNVLGGEIHFRGEYQNPRRHADQRRHFEVFDRAHEADHPHRQDCRQQNAHRDTQGRAHDTGAGDHCGFFQRRVHRAQRRREQQESKWDLIGALYPDHSRHVVDFDGLVETQLRRD